MEMVSFCENCSPRLTVTWAGGSTLRCCCGWAQQKTARNESAISRLLLLTEECLDFIEIFILARQSYMRRKGEPALTVDDECGRERIDTTVQLADRIIAQNHPVIHLMRRNVRLNRLPSVLVHRNADDLEASALELLLEFNKPGNLERTWTAPRRPEIHDDDFPSQVAQLKRVPVSIFKHEVGRRLALSGRLGLFLSSSGAGDRFVTSR